ncbi:hypothetical protein [Nannocystis sp. SCPEA4]|uniref:hypothetical protein n=1 Tax=Nannocystis sp. SCPEA4 TaxID=2996787 RepID=UPI00226E3A97|nr:hypothetical protein [Nannocystis sp. SCPEA4]
MAAPDNNLSLTPGTCLFYSAPHLSLAPGGHLARAFAEEFAPGRPARRSLAAGPVVL